MPDKEWRCFHCDEVFTEREAAADHFGVQIDGLADDTGCKLTEQEGGILKMLREAQEELRRYHEEDHAMARTFYALGGEHNTAMMREEEKGYARGLADGRAALVELRGLLERALSDWEPDLGKGALGNKIRRAISPYTIDRSVCVVCGKQTVLACSDCAIDAGGKRSVHVCKKTKCRDEHERQCHEVLA